MCLGTNMSRHKRVWAQTSLGTNESGHKRVWAQTCLDTTVWAQVCMGTCGLPKLYLVIECIPSCY